jgi:hypothetical protein
MRLTMYSVFWLSRRSEYVEQAFPLCRADCSQSVGDAFLKRRVPFPKGRWWVKDRFLGGQIESVLGDVIWKRFKIV